MKKFTFLMSVVCASVFLTSVVNADNQAKRAGTPPAVVIRTDDAVDVSTIEPAAGANTTVIIQTKPTMYDAITGKPVADGPALREEQAPTLRDKIRGKME